jgi:periplasmic copper chaperone A
MTAFQRLLAALALGLAAATAPAHEFKAGPITIGHPYARTTAPGQPNGGGFLKLVNQGATADKLLSASTAAAGSVELHTMRMEGDVMRMRQVDTIELPAGGTVELKPGGMHLMFIGLKQPLVAGEKFPLTLRFEKAGEVIVTVNVEAPKPAAPASEHKHH